MNSHVCKSGLGLALLLATASFQSQAGLVGYWAFDEGQGTAIADTSGFGNNGTLVGATAATWTRGRVGSALYFDGTSAAGVYIPNSPSLQLTNAASFAAWVRCDNPAAAPILSKEGNPPYHLSYWFGVSGGHFGAQLDRDGAQPWDFAGLGEGNIIAGQWIHLAATWDGTNVSYYTNGVRLPDTASFTGPIFLGTGRLGIGVNSEYGDYRFTGAIDEVRVYSHALSPAEVSALAAMGQTPARALPPGLVAAYNANGSAVDSSGGGADGSFTGSYVPGISGQAFSIDSQAHNFGAPAPNLPTGAAPRTMSWWVNIQGDPGPHDASTAGEWLGYGGGGNNSQYSIGYFNDQEGGWQPNQILFTQVGWGLGGPVLATNTWYYVAVTYDGGNLKMYVNGVYYSSASHTLATPASGNSLWCSYKNPDFYADNIRIYDSALTPSQILDDYNLLEVSNAVATGPRQWRATDGGNGHWYEVVAPGPDLDWAAAQSAAAARGGYLACVTSAAENNFIFGLVHWPKYWSARSWGYLGPWLGGSYSYSQPAGWSWVSGEAWGFANWCPGEPDYYAGLDDRVAFSTVGSANPPYQPTWGDVSHSDTSPAFVVEYTSNPRALLFPTNATILAGDSAYEGKDLVISNCTLTINGPHSFGSLLLISNAVVTHPAVPGGESTNRIDLTIAGDLTVDASSRVDVSAKGYGPWSGPGAGAAYYGYGAAGHGGGGGAGQEPGGGTYDSITNPISAGSGGADYGGGVVRLAVAGQLLVDGSLLANGARGSASSGGAAGGSINLQVGSLSGGGMVEANGGDAAYGNYSGGGGGGRIAVYYAGSSFSGSFQAYGGAAGYRAAQRGGAGTVCWQAAGAAVPLLVVDGGGATLGASTPVSGASQLLGLLAANGANISSADLTSVGGDLVVSNTSAASFSALTGVGGNVVVNGSTAALNLTNSIGQSVWVVNGGVLTHTAGQTNGLLLNVAGDMTVDASSRADVSAKGYGPWSGPGVGAQFYGYGAAGHGGAGGAGQESGGGTYGSLTNPISAGSGGADYGGGVLRLAVAGQLRVDGSLLANGARGSASSGGAAGGSINLQVGSLSGGGMVEANGGDGAYGNYSGGGGGGRIAMYYTSSSFSGSFQAYGGAAGYSGAQWGGAGTVYLMQGGASLPQLVLDGGGAIAGPSTPIGGVGQLPSLWVGGGANASFPDLITLRGDLVVTRGSAASFAALTSVGGNVAVTNSALVSAVSLSVGGSLSVAGSSGSAALNLTNTVGEGVWVVDGGVLTHTAGQTDGLVLSVTGDMTVDASSRADVSGKGYGPWSGPGAGAAYYGYGAAGHGGAGGAGQEPGGGTYDSLTNPISAGSGGAGYGGGALRVVVAGQLRVDGSLVANGAGGSGSSGGAAGGSINLKVGSLSGSGMVEANGGNGAYGNYSGGGGGGRVTVYYTSSSFSGSFQAYGGAAGYSGAQRGGAGTICWQTAGAALPLLVVDDGGTTLGAGTPVSGASQLQGLWAANGANLSCADLTALGGDLVVSNVSMASFSALSVVGGSVLVNGATAELNLTNTIGQNVWVVDGGVLTHTAGQTNGLLLKVAGDMTVDASSRADVSGKGYGPWSGPGAGAAYYGYGAAGHGGAGGAGQESGGGTYDSLTNPISAGSGGADYGGGVLRLAVAGQLRVDGSLLANGSRGSGSSGGAAGGSINLQVGSLSGGGLVEANGGNGAYGNYSGGGGGGRIALYCLNSLYYGSFQAAGGAAGYSGAQAGGTGTVFVAQSCPNIAVLPASLPAAVAPLPYHQVLSAAGGAGPYGFGLAAGSLPPGLSLDPGGLLSGTPTSTGTNTFVVSAVDTNGCTGVAVYTIVSLSLPLITSPPRSQTSTIGTTAVFTVDATGSLPLSCQWQFQGVDLADDGRITGSRGSTLTITNVIPGDAGAYTVIVSNPIGSTTSAAAILTVRQLTPTLTWTTPAPVPYGTALGAGQLNATANVPGTNVYSPPAGTVLDAGTHTLTMVFSPRDGADYSPATATVSLVVAPAPLVVSVNDTSRAFGQTNPPFSGSLSGLVNNDPITAVYGCPALPASPPGVYPILPSLVDPLNRLANYAVTLTNGRLTVGPAPAPAITGITPTFGSPAGGTTVALNGSGFEIGAAVFFGPAGSPSVTVTSPSALTAVTPSGTNGTAAIRLVNPDGGTVTLAGAFTYAAPPVVQTQPTNQTVLAGGSAVFTASATGTPPMSYQWQLDGANLSDGGAIRGAWTPDLWLTNALPTNAGNYRLVVSNAFGWAASAVAQLTVVRATPVVNWPTPAGITYGTALNSNQLDATTATPGTFAYLPPWGTVPDAGSRTLVSIFTPTDTMHYDSVTSGVALAVSRAPLLVVATNALRAFGAGNPTFYGSVFGAVNHDPFGISLACAAVPASPPGSYPIVPTLLDPNGRAGNYYVTNLNGTLTVRPQPGPSITLLSPSAGPTEGGTPVILFGSGFEVGASVTFGTNPAPTVVVSGPNNLTATTPAAPAGAVAVTVFNPDGTSAARTNAFTYGMAPVIHAAPTNQSVVLGGTVQFRVAATGDELLSYHWQLNGVDLAPGPRVAGVATNVLTIANLTPADAGVYRVLVQNAFGRAQSADATLTVGLPPTIAVQPQNQASGPGGGVAFTVGVAGTPPLYFQWYQNGTPLPGADSSTLALGNIQATNAGAYTVVITNAAGGVTSQVAQLAYLTHCASVSVAQPAYAPGVAVPLHVRTFDCGSNSTAVPNAPVVVWIFRAGAARQVAATTSVSGLGVAQFNPLPGEMGTFEFGVALPGQGAPAPTGSFTVLGMAAGSADLTSRLVVGFPQTYGITLTNPTLVGLNGITATAVGLPPNVKMHVVSVPAVISGGNTAVATIQLSALDTSYTQGSFTLQFGSVEGAVVSLRVNVTITQLLPQLVATPDTLAGSMVGGRQTLVSLEVANQGATDSGDLRVLIPSVPWISLVTTQVVASLAPGQSNLVTLALTPDVSLPLGAYPGQITLAGTNTQLVVPFNFNCVSTLRGTLQVTAQDQLSLLAAGAPNVSNATVTVTDFLTGTQVGSGVTDDSGILLFTNLVSAYYTIHVDAPEHGSFQTTFLLAADQTNSLTAFLPLQLVNYTWTVVPTQVADSYDFTLTTTFQTQVPWPVLTVSPGAIDLCQFVGDTNQILLTITNSGLIAAQNVQLVFGGNPDWLLVPLVGSLGDVAAESAVVVPVTVIRLGSSTSNVPSNVGAQVNWSVITPTQTFYSTTPIFVYNANPYDCAVHSTPVVTLSSGSTGGVGDTSSGWTSGPGFSPYQPIVSTPSYSFPPPAQGAIVQVKLQIDQTAVITRNAFKATLQLDNGADSTVSNLSVTLHPVDAQGQPATNAFFIATPNLGGINAVDGTGTLDPGASGTATWTLIPTRSAAPLGTTSYAIGGTLAYTLNGDQVTIPLFAVPITVLPDPRLEVDYFLEHDVYSDDPFTPAVEPSIPFHLGVLMRNAGLGTARSVTITSAQPTIVENDNGLLIGFQIVGSQAGAMASVAPSLTLDLGDIPPGTNALGLWAMTSSLEGSFISFDATYQHTDALGGTSTSLIDTVTTHFLTHVVQTPAPLDDGLPDFLANDSTNVDALPNHLYSSDGSVSNVTALTDADPGVSVRGVPSSSNPTTTISVSGTPTGYLYLEVADPADGTLAIASVSRADGTPLLMDRNVWQTPRRTHMVPPQSRNLVHLFDYRPAGSNSYLVTYGLPPAPPRATTLLGVLDTARSATLNAQVNPGGANTTVLFQWGSSPDLGNQTITTTLNQALNVDQVVSLPITDLLPGQTIYFQVIAANVAGSATGAVQTLSISAQPPAVATGAASLLTSTNVTLNTLVNAEGAATQVYFQWGFTTGYGNFSHTNVISTNLNADLPVALSVGPTLLGQTYHYRAVAMNTSGVMWGADYVLDVRPSAAIIPSGDGTFTLGGLAIMDRTHTLWATTNVGPSAVWHPIATGLRGLDGTWGFSDGTFPPPPHLYYRISTP